MAVNGMRLMSPRSRGEESFRNPTLIELLKRAGYEVRRSAEGMLIVRGLKLVSGHRGVTSGINTSRSGHETRTSIGSCIGIGGPL